MKKKWKRRFLMNRLRRPRKCIGKKKNRVVGKDQENWEDDEGKYEDEK